MKRKRPFAEIGAVGDDTEARPCRSAMRRATSKKVRFS